MDLDVLVWDERGLLPVILQDAATGSVLTLAYANRAALEETIATGQTVLFSRSRNALWKKGESSGNTQTVESIAYDCDADALLYRVTPAGPACHTGAATCFHTMLHGEPDAQRPFLKALSELRTVLRARKSGAPEGSYVGSLYREGVDAICSKVGEEAIEVVIAAKNGDTQAKIWESADLLVHLLVLIEYQNIELDDIGIELLRRQNPNR